MSARLDKILGRFKRTVQELDNLVAMAEDEIRSHDEEISRLHENRVAIVGEKVMAATAAGKIRELIAA